ncbi:hypothetical protein F5B18DRAFT_8845 [Nemania serpens]|nr:hypothetical protein F5B18DRAFT_8845 [Nemania serpens]
MRALVTVGSLHQRLGADVARAPFPTCRSRRFVGTLPFVVLLAGLRVIVSTFLLEWYTSEMCRNRQRSADTTVDDAITCMNKPRAPYRPDPSASYNTSPLRGLLCGLFVFTEITCTIRIPTRTRIILSAVFRLRSIVSQEPLDWPQISAGIEVYYRLKMTDRDWGWRCWIAQL